VAEHLEADEYHLRVKAERLCLGRSLRAVARSIGKSESYLGALERGTVRPSPLSPVLTALCIYYGVPLGEASSLLEPVKIRLVGVDEGERGADPGGN
jgi:transcriptional regulator with XRE-family HTH domain